MLGCLYCSQGLPFGFFTQALPVMMRDQGADLILIGLSSLLALPWAMKFAWAPLIDRYGSKRLGRRKTWILGLQGCSALLFILLARGKAEQLQILLTATLLMNLFAATQDIATDGLAVNLLHERERGFGNGLQVAGYRLGMFLGGGVILMIFSYLQWSGSFYMMAFLILLGTIPVLLFREDANTEPETQEAFEGVLLHAFKKDGFPAWLGLVAFYKMGDAMATQMLRPYFRDAGMGLEEMGFVFGVLGFIGGLVGALLGGWLAGVHGRRITMIWFAVFQAAALLGYWALSQGLLPPSVIEPLVTIEHITGGMATAALFTAMMDRCDRETASTDYTIQASASVIATGVAGIAGGIIAETAGYGLNFLLGAAACLLSIFWIQLVMKPGIPGQVQVDPA